VIFQLLLSGIGAGSELPGLTNRKRPLSPCNPLPAPIQFQNILIFLATTGNFPLLPQDKKTYRLGFTEVYRASAGFDSWRSGAPGAFAPVKCSAQPEKKLLRRGVPHPRFSLRGVAGDRGTGRMVSGTAPEKLWKDRSMTGVGQKFKGFAEAELATVPSLEIQRMKSVPDPVPRLMTAADSEICLPSGAYQILDFGTNLTGFIGARIRCAAPVRLWMTFDEPLTAGDVDFKRLGCINLIAWDLAPGEYDVESFEPYTLRSTGAAAASRSRVDSLRWNGGARGSRFAPALVSPAHSPSKIGDRFVRGVPQPSLFPCRSDHIRRKRHDRPTNPN